MFEIVDPSSLSVLGRERLEKYGSTLDDDNIELVCQRIVDYPEIIAAVSELLQSPHTGTYDHELRIWRHERHE